MRTLSPLFVVFAVACSAEAEPPDLAYTVEVFTRVDDNAIVSDCITEGQTYRETFTYELFFEGSNLELKVGSGGEAAEAFASGTRSGCELVYESAVWLEERPAGDLRWQLLGSAVNEGGSGGCDLTEGLDWEGTEVIEVVESDDPTVEEGCTYELVTEGTLKAG